MIIAEFVIGRQKKKRYFLFLFIDIEYFEEVSFYLG